MASPDQIIQQIRFAFETLSERNAQHEFEHLCRHFARARISSNILPATGPVAAGGDQGRDFETFRTFVTESGEGRFCALAETKKIVFACSLNNQVTAKVKTDVASIMGGGQRPDLIYFFTSRSVTINARHKLQTWALSKYSVELEILDCNALAEQLSEAELFWIAARYLGVPPEIFPKSDQAGSGYDRLRDKWFVEAIHVERFADFIEIKRAARHALDEAPQDLSRWISLLTDYEKRCEGAHELRQARYEIIALTMRQRRSLKGEEDRVRAFFSDTSVFDLPDVAAEAETIHCYATGAKAMGEAELTNEELQRWHSEISHFVECGTESPLSQNQLCLWLQLRGRIEMHTHSYSQKIENWDYSAIFDPWSRLIEILPDAPMFPVEDFHDLVLLLTDLLEDPPILNQLLEKLRPILAERAGAAALADSHFRRAENFLEKGQLPKAMFELHSARMKWFVQETAGESAHCCLLLARCYQRLGLNFAAIYYSLAASYIFANAIGSSTKFHTHEGLHDAVESAYSQGHWCLYFEMASSALAVEASNSPAGLDATKSIHFKSFLKNLPMALYAVRRLLPSVFDTVMRDYRKIGFETFVLDRMNDIQQEVHGWTDEKFRAVMQNSFVGAPFSDAGDRCTAVWAAHGIQWCFRWKNNYDAFRVSLEVVAFFQIAVSELIGCDLDIIPGTLIVDIELTDNAMLTAEQMPDNSVYRWLFHAPRNIKYGTTGLDDFRSQILTCLVQIVRAISVMPKTEFFEAFENGIAPHIYEHDFFARRFPELLDFFAGREKFGIIGRSDFSCPFNPTAWKTKPSSFLDWINTTHPKYDHPVELERIQKRYDRSFAGLQYTLPRLLNDSGFADTVNRLRAKGWKDWHLLMAMLNGVGNYRARLQFNPHSNRKEFEEAMKDEMYSPEKPNSPTVPPSEFSQYLLELYLVMALGSNLISEGLEMHQRTPNSEGLFEYARYRWHYFDNDVEHKEVFPGR